MPALINTCDLEERHLDSNGYDARVPAPWVARTTPGRRSFARGPLRRSNAVLYLIRTRSLFSHLKRAAHILIQVDDQSVDHQSDCRRRAVTSEHRQSAEA